MPNPAEKKFADINAGDTAQFECTISSEMVSDFAKLSGDYNPLHMSEEYAATTPFKHRIAHGMIAGALFSRLVGMHLPGLYCLYLSQTIHFKNPVYLNSEVLVTGKVITKSDAAQTLTITLTATNKKTGMIAAVGEALVQVSAHYLS